MKIEVGDLLRYTDTFGEIHQYYYCLVMRVYRDGMDREGFEVVWLNNDRDFQKNFRVHSISRKSGSWRKLS